MISRLWHNKTIVLLILVFLIGFAYYYFFVDTLKMSEIIGSTNIPAADILINLFDFDTGLTRYDIHHLAQKSEYWDMRMKQVIAIQDPQQREVENQKLVAEMMRDPTMKKIVKRLFGFGWDSALAIIQAAKGF